MPNFKEYKKILIRREDELGNIITEEDAVEYINKVISIIGKGTFNKILNLNWEDRDFILRVLELLSKD